MLNELPPTIFLTLLTSSCSSAHFSFAIHTHVVVIVIVFAIVAFHVEREFSFVGFRRWPLDHTRTAANFVHRHVCVCVVVSWFFLSSHVTILLMCWHSHKLNVLLLLETQFHYRFASADTTMHMRFDFMPLYRCMRLYVVNAVVIIIVVVGLIPFCLLASWLS